MQPNRAYAMSISFKSQGYPDGEHNGQAAIGNMDGSWWIDWDRLDAMYKFEIEAQVAKPNAEAQYIVMLIELLLLARGRGLREVSWEQQEKIAQEYGAKMQIPNIDIDASIKNDIVS
jgi:hypothetical protein